MRISKKFYYSFFLLSLALFGLQFFEFKNFIFKDSEILWLRLNYSSKSLTENWIGLDRLPEDTVNTLIRIEDKRFFTHKGYSLKDIHSSIFKFILFHRKLRGASTITQQLARTLFLTREKTLDRKIKEIRISVDLEKEISKKEILEYYINTVYWGHGNYGLHAAALYYFQTPPEELDISQIRSLIDILKKPDNYDIEDFPENS
ncbi:MAG: transglycosylase domain-containing protein [Leptospiraceae bacterium]|nr:transglycosylase domain-containing protein [Leptospiraceae bacterium]